MDNSPIELELRKLGLTEKEARVYLAGLELGPSSVQNIAQKTGLTRPTTYEIVKKLETKKLLVEAGKKGKRAFTVQSPENILGLLRTQKREIDEKEREFIRIISALEAKYSKEKQSIKAFKGEEGLKVLAEIVSFSSTPEIIIINSKLNPIAVKEREKIYEAIKKRLGKIELKEIETKINGSLIIFDKIIFFPRNKTEGILIETWVTNQKPPRNGVVL